MCWLVKKWILALWPIRTIMEFLFLVHLWNVSQAAAVFRDVEGDRWAEAAGHSWLIWLRAWNQNTDAACLFACTTFTWRICMKTLTTANVMQTGTAGGFGRDNRPSLVPCLFESHDILLGMQSKIRQSLQEWIRPDVQTRLGWWLKKKNVDFRDFVMKILSIFWFFLSRIILFSRQNWEYRNFIATLLAHSDQVTSGGSVKLRLETLSPAL